MRRLVRLFPDPRLLDLRGFGVLVKGFDFVTEYSSLDVLPRVDFGRYY
jgi:hypothetical protein